MEGAERQGEPRCQSHEGLDAERQLVARIPPYSGQAVPVGQRLSGRVDTALEGGGQLAIVAEAEARAEPAPRQVGGQPPFDVGLAVTGAEVEEVVAPVDQAGRQAHQPSGRHPEGRTIDQGVDQAHLAVAGPLEDRIPPEEGANCAGGGGDEAPELRLGQSSRREERVGREPGDAQRPQRRLEAIDHAEDGGAGGARGDRHEGGGRPRIGQEPEHIRPEGGTVGERLLGERLLDEVTVVVAVGDLGCQRRERGVELGEEGRGLRRGEVEPGIRVGRVEAEQGL